MNRKNSARHIIIPIILLSALVWSLSQALGSGSGEAYPNARFIVSADWLKQHLADEGLVVVDVRGDKYFDGTVIPGAVRLPWSEFRYDDIDENLGEKFAGPDKAQQVLGKYGITRSDTVLLYDSVERDGGATASYIFWVLDLLGHERMMLLDGGIDGWRAAGFETAKAPIRRDPVLYQAPSGEMKPWVLADGEFVYRRLGDPMYQIIDVRSREEYIGEKGSLDLRGEPLKLGHIPTAVNVDYRLNWVDEEHKKLKPYADLRKLYRGLDSNRAVIVYCDSGRRGSFGYFVMRVMGIQPVMSYEASWKEWGVPDRFYPVELVERRFGSDTLPGASETAVGEGRRVRSEAGSGDADSRLPASGSPKGGYVSCGG
ncbi:sulfurtransferase [Desulfococcus sp.]|uniref:sulfurtransferase n=1 Tax=Desulfococcus sp. TaxID=2025834 RepID=UPI003D106631